MEGRRLMGVGLLNPPSSSRSNGQMIEKGIIRGDDAPDFELIPRRTAQELGPDALGILVHYLSMPAWWRIRMHEVDEWTGYSRQRRRSAFRELREKGYAALVRIPGKGGQIDGSDYVFRRYGNWYDDGDGLEELVERCAANLRGDLPPTDQIPDGRSTGRPVSRRDGEASGIIEEHNPREERIKKKTPPTEPLLPEGFADVDEVERAMNGLLKDLDKIHLPECLRAVLDYEWNETGLRELCGEKWGRKWYSRIDPVKFNFVIKFCGKTPKLVLFAAVVLVGNIEGARDRMKLLQSTCMRLAGHSRKATRQ